jgi:hypothetical protein
MLRLRSQLDRVNLIRRFSTSVKEKKKFLYLYYYKTFFFFTDDEKNLIRLTRSSCVRSFNNVKTILLSLCHGATTIRIMAVNTMTGRKRNYQNILIVILSITFWFHRVPPLYMYDIQGLYLCISSFLCHVSLLTLSLSLSIVYLLSIYLSLSLLFVSLSLSLSLSLPLFIPFIISHLLLFVLFVYPFLSLSLSRYLLAIHSL